MTPISLPVGSGNSGTNDWADVYNNDAQLVTEIDDRDGNYQTILTTSAGISEGAAAGTYLFYPTVQRKSASEGSSAPPLDYLYFDDADYSVSSKTQKLRVRAQIALNGTAWSSVTATVGLYPITSGGSAGNFQITTGTVVSNSTVAFANPSASTIAQGNSGDFTIPSDDAYALAFVLGATVPTNSEALLSAQLQTRWV